MYELHGTKIATFGGNLNNSMEYKGSPFAGIWWGLSEFIFVLAGMAGNQVLEWSDLDSEIKTAGLKDVSGVTYLSMRCLADCPT